MEQTSNPSLVERLCKCAALWTEAHAAPPTRIGRKVVNDGGLIPRLESEGGDVRTATLEKFAAFFVDPANWPEGKVPEMAVSLAHDVGVSAPAAPASSGNSPADPRESETKEAA